jgi:hypothetical protein
LLTQAKTGISALSLRRQLGVSYNTAWSIKQKLMQVMKERDDSQPLSGIIQLDDVYWGVNNGAVNEVEALPTKHPLWPLCQLTKRGSRWP